MANTVRIGHSMDFDRYIDAIPEVCLNRRKCVMNYKTWMQKWYPTDSGVSGKPEYQFYLGQLSDPVHLLPGNSASTQGRSVYLKPARLWPRKWVWFWWIPIPRLTRWSLKWVPNPTVCLKNRLNPSKPGSAFFVPKLQDVKLCFKSAVIGYIMVCVVCE